MALPKMDSPVYEIELPLSKQKVKFRPFLVKEQRNLLIAIESEDKEMIQNNIIKVIKDCIIDDIDVERLPVLDIEYFFLHLRARSVGEVVENSYKCNNIIEDEKVCSNVMNVKVNLLDIAVEKPENITDTFKLTDKITVKLKYPEFSIMRRMSSAEGIEDFAFSVVAQSIDYVHDGEQFYYAKEYTPDELLEFVESLNQAQFDNMQKFFEDLPKLKKKVDFKCSKCGYDHSMDVEGLENFFV